MKSWCCYAVGIAVVLGTFAVSDGRMELSANANADFEMLEDGSLMPGVGSHNDQEVPVVSGGEEAKKPLPLRCIPLRYCLKKKAICIRKCRSHYAAVAVATTRTTEQINDDNPTVCSVRCSKCVPTC